MSDLLVADRAGAGDRGPAVGGRTAAGAASCLAAAAQMPEHALRTAGAVGGRSGVRARLAGAGLMQAVDRPSTLSPRRRYATDRHAERSGDIGHERACSYQRRLMRCMPVRASRREAAVSRGIVARPVLGAAGSGAAAGARRSLADARPDQRRAGRREADRRRRQHLDQPDHEGAGGRAAAERAEGRAVRRVLRRFLQPQGRPLAVRPQGLLARLRLRHRRQGRPRSSPTTTSSKAPTRSSSTSTTAPSSRSTRCIGKDTKTDLALLKVTPKKPLPAVKFGSSTKMRGRRLGHGDRQPVRPRRLGDGRHHLGQAARHQLRSLRRLPADGRRHQQGQLRRPAVQHGRRGHRREYGDHLADRRLDRHRLCGALRYGRWSSSINCANTARRAAAGSA